MDYKNVEEIRKALKSQFPYFAGVIDRQIEEFGDEWLSLFDRDLEAFFEKDKERISAAVKGYGKFALDSMRLQVKFQKNKKYDEITYEQAHRNVYQDRQYMFDLYLPGIYLSHYLWRHHFLQHIFFHQKFLPLVEHHGGTQFYDIGIGTGFYSKEMLTNLAATGEGFDLSPFSIEHTMTMLRRHGVDHRYTTNLRNIVTEPVQTPAPFIINVEVLEHLDNPQQFLGSLCRMLEPGGYGFITAAVNAPNADHIYLYRSGSEVARQIEAAHFKIVDHIEDEAYKPRTDGELVPINAAFIVTM